MREVKDLSWLERRLLLEEMNRDHENQKRAAESKPLIDEDPEDAPYEAARNAALAEYEAQRIESEKLKKSKNPEQPANRTLPGEDTDSWMRSMGVATR